MLRKEIIFKFVDLTISSYLLRFSPYSDVSYSKLTLHTFFFENHKNRRLFEDAGRVSFVDLQDHGRAKIRFESPYDADQGIRLANIF